MPRLLLWRLLPFLAAAGFFAVMAGLYLGDGRPLYFRIIRWWGVDPWPVPFLDADTVLSALRCRRAGIDVFASNPCDPLQRVYDYSPLWLVLAHLPVTPAWLVPAGLVVDALFLLALLFLPPARESRAALVLALAAVSPPVLFAVERGNNDLVLFALAVLAAALVRRSAPLRAIGYGAALLAGLLKYYPMPLLALACRERPRAFAAVVAAVLALVAAFLWAMGDELGRALQLVPDGSWRGGMFGAPTLAIAIAGHRPLPQALVRVVMAGAAVFLALRLARRSALADDLRRLTDAEATTLLAGALLTLGCFFTAQNIAYRMIHLILVLPAVTALAGQIPRRRYPLLIVAVLMVMWSDAWRGGPDLRGGSSEYPVLVIAGALLRELMWWGTITWLIAASWCLVMASEMGGFAQRLLARPRG